jgi:hypothetical protein
MLVLTIHQQVIIIEIPLLHLLFYLIYEICLYFLRTLLYSRLEQSFPQHYAITLISN